MERILVAVAHPDDETIGCGASLARFAHEGREIAVWFASDGVASRLDRPQDAADRMSAARRALKHLGIHSVVAEDYPDNALDTVPRLHLARSLDRLVRDFRPTCVISHSQCDLNVDHRLVGEVAAIVSRPQPGSSIRDRWCMEIPSSSHWFPEGRNSFRPNIFIDVTAYWELKRAALLEYGVEIPDWPHARSVAALEALSRYRGSTVGVEAAEAFEVAFSSR